MLALIQDGQRGISLVPAKTDPMPEKIGGRIPSMHDDRIAVALLTGGGDKPYAYGLTMALLSKGAAVDVIGGDDLDHSEFHCKPGLTFLNLRGDQNSDASIANKLIRIVRYYARLFRYSAKTKAAIFHILWNNKFELFDRTLLMSYYRLLGKRIVLTAHNVNARRRDRTDTLLNRLTLRIQYRLAHHIFVHTEKMKLEILHEFGVRASRVTVIPFGINNAVPNTDVTSADAKRQLGIQDGERTILFFGRITPYKGLEYLITAFGQVRARHNGYRLVIAGRPEIGNEEYWSRIQAMVGEDVREGRVLLRAGFIPDDETELYLKAADVLVLPYRQIYQSGVLFLAQSFGLPVLASDVGSLKDDIAEGKTGFLFGREDPGDLAKAIEKYFASALYRDLVVRRQDIRDYAAARHSWDVVGQITMSIYAALRRGHVRARLANGSVELSPSDD